jgi:hypothetical protein
MRIADRKLAPNEQCKPKRRSIDMLYRSNVGGSAVQGWTRKHDLASSIGSQERGVDRLKKTASKIDCEI